MTVDLTDFGSADAPNHEATHTCLLALMCGQNNRRDIAEQLLGGTILDWTWKDEEFWRWGEEGMMPQTFIFRQGRKLLVCIRGTQNAGQWRSHITGAPGLEFSDVPGFALAHGFHLRMARKVIRRFRFALGGTTWDEFDRVFFAGHSYGAAVAQLAGMIWAQLHPEHNVQIATWGGPRTCTNGYEGRPPLAFFRYVTQADPVPLVPFGTITILDLIGPLNKVASWVNRVIKVGSKYVASVIERYSPRAWQHYGTGFLFSSPYSETSPWKPWAERNRIDLQQFSSPDSARTMEEVFIEDHNWASNHLTDTGYFPAWCRWASLGKKPFGDRGIP